MEAATRAWRSSRYPAEDAEPAQVRVWGEHAPLTALFGQLRPDEPDLGQPHRFGACAMRLWAPLLGVERTI